MTDTAYQATDTATPQQIIQMLQTGQPVPVGDQVRVCMQLRDARKKLNAELDRKEKVIRQCLDFIEASLLRTANEQGVTGFPTDHGRVSIRTDSKPRIRDAEAFNRFVLDNGRVDFLQKRPAEGSIKEYQKETGLAVPGIEMFQERKVVITKT